MRDKKTVFWGKGGGIVLFSGILHLHPAESRSNVIFLKKFMHTRDTEFLMLCNESLLQVEPGHSSMLYTVMTVPPPRYSFGAAGRPGTGSRCILALIHWCQEISAGVLTCLKADTPLPWGPETPLGYTGKSLNCKNMEKCLRDLENEFTNNSRSRRWHNLLWLSHQGWQKEKRAKDYTGPLFDSSASYCPILRKVFWHIVLPPSTCYIKCTASY